MTDELAMLAGALAFGAIIVALVFTVLLAEADRRTRRRGRGR